MHIGGGHKKSRHFKQANFTFTHCVQSYLMSFEEDISNFHLIVWSTHMFKMGEREKHYFM